jgi:hypothetical protein
MNRLWLQTVRQPHTFPRTTVVGSFRIAENPTCFLDEFVRARPAETETARRPSLFDADQDGSIVAEPP